MIKYEAFYKNKDKDVEKIALELREFMQKENIFSKLEESNQVNVRSQKIQSILLPFLEKKKFQSEVKGLFAGRSLRPDYYNRKNKIMVEVERGRTRANNMDLLDIWKCHINAETKHLFLVVPIFRPSKNGRSTRVFNPVVNKIKSFFDEDNYINVESCYIFGY